MPIVEIGLAILGGLAAGAAFVAIKRIVWPWLKDFADRMIRSISGFFGHSLRAITKIFVFVYEVISIKGALGTGPLSAAVIDFLVSVAAEVSDYIAGVFIRYSNGQEGADFELAPSAPGDSEIRRKAQSPNGYWIETAY